MMKSSQRELERLYNEFSQQLFVCALAVTGSPDLAEDAVQDAFCRLLRHDRVPRNLKAYVFRSVRNAAVDLIRRDKPMRACTDDYIFNSSRNPREEAARIQFQRMVAQALRTLSEDERETIILHLYVELTYREIAELRSRSINTIVSWYQRGLVKLRACLEE